MAASLCFQPQLLLSDSPPENLPGSVNTLFPPLSLRARGEQLPTLASPGSFSIFVSFPNPTHPSVVAPFMQLTPRIPSEGLLFPAG